MSHPSIRDNVNAIKANRASFFFQGFLIDVQDMARLLVAATAKSSLPNECIFAYYKHFTWDDLREKIREIRPELIKGDDQRL